ISVCEDAWWPGPPWEQYARLHTAVIPNINASPYYREKSAERLEVVRSRARETGAWIVYVNAVGGQDELVFDGGSIVMSPDGALAMPSPYSSAGSVEDAIDVAGRLGIRLDEVRIDDVFKAYLGALEDLFRDTDEGVAEENLQARIRGNLLMALSNKFGVLVLATGNKSEYAVGFATLYGDMSGGFAPIKDVPKTLVYELCAWRNARAAERGETPPIPQSVIDKPPSAELRPDQLDTDTLPSYDVLDPIIEAYVEDDLG